MAHEEMCAEASEAMNRISTHEAVCEERYRQINAGMARMEKTTSEAHNGLYRAVHEINKSIRSVLVWAVLLFGGSTVSLVVYIYTQMSNKVTL